MKKRMTTVFLTAVLLIMLAFPALAAGEGALAMESVSAAAGEEVVLTLDLAANPGMITLRVSIAFDETALSLVSAESTGLLRGLVAPSPSLCSPYILFWKDSFAAENNTATGPLAVLTFRVQPGAAGSIPVTVSALESYDANFKKNRITAANAVISVEPEKTSLAGASLTVDDAITPTLYFDRDAASDPAFFFELSGAQTAHATAADLYEDGAYLAYDLPATGASGFCDEILFTSSFGERKTFSILSICQNGIEKEYAGKTEKLTALLKSVYNFGLCAKDVFCPQSTFAGEPYEDCVYRGSFDAARIDDAARESASGAIRFTGADLSLGSRTGITLYAVSPADFAVKSDGKVLHERYYESSPIPAEQQSAYGGATVQITLFCRAPAFSVPFSLSLCAQGEEASLSGVCVPAAARLNADSTQQALMQSVLCYCEAIDAYAHP